MTRIPARRIVALLGAALPIWALAGPAVAQGAPPPAPPVAGADLATFQAQLRPLGEFLRIPRLGLGWRPAYVPEDWRPYSVGQWIWNDRVGWYFSSQEPWAEITYHYGRWYQDPVVGWVWFSGTRWAPAWVEWRRDREFVGWRPLPPDDLPPPPRGGPRPYDTRYQDTWVFVPTRDIAADDLRPARLPRTDQRDLRAHAAGRSGRAARERDGQPAVPARRRPPRRRCRDPLAQPAAIARGTGARRGAVDLQRTSRRGATLRTAGRCARRARRRSTGRPWP